MSAGAIVSMFASNHYHPPIPRVCYNPEPDKIVDKLNKENTNMYFKRDNDMIIMVMKWKDDYERFHIFDYMNKDILKHSIEIYNHQMREWKENDKYRI